MSDQRGETRDERCSPWSLVSGLSSLVWVVGMALWSLISYLWSEWYVVTPEPVRD